MSVIATQTVSPPLFDETMRKFRLARAMDLASRSASYARINIRGRARGQAVRHRQEELPLLQGRGVRDDDDGDTDRAQERIDTRALPRVAFRELRKASG